MTDPSQDPVAIATALTTLLAALGLSSTAGIRAYLPLLAIGLASDSHLIQLQQSFSDLGSPGIVILLIILVVGEFIIDKVPVVDHISDVVHTVIRPVSGAVVMAGTANPISSHYPWVAAAIGALLALVFHGAKATARPAVSATTAGVGNPIVSLIEDVLAVVVALLLLFAPVIGFVLLVVLVIAAFRIVGRIVRRFTRGRRAPQAAGAPGMPAFAGGGSGNSGSMADPVEVTVAATHNGPYLPLPNPTQPTVASSVYPERTQTLRGAYPPQWPAAPNLPSEDAPTNPGSF